MRANLTLLITSAILLFQACGISAEEKHKIEQALLDRQARQDSVQALLNQMDGALSATRDTLAVAKAALEAARVTLDRVKQWQIGRTSSERDQQIMNASLNVQRIEASIQYLQSQEQALLRDKDLTIKKAEYVEGVVKAYEADN